MFCVLCEIDSWRPVTLSSFHSSKTFIILYKHSLWRSKPLCLLENCKRKKETEFLVKFISDVAPNETRNVPLINEHALLNSMFSEFQTCSIAQMQVKLFLYCSRTGNPGFISSTGSMKDPVRPYVPTNNNSNMSFLCHLGEAKRCAR